MSPRRAQTVSAAFAAATLTLLAAAPARSAAGVRADGRYFRDAAGRVRGRECVEWRLERG